MKDLITNQWTDRRVEATLGTLLRIGVGVSAVVILVGGVIHIARHGLNATDYRVFHGAPAEFRTVRGILSSAVDLQGRGIIQLGLLLLIATPIVRVAFSIFGFGLERDRMYMVFTAIVLLILLSSILGFS